MVNLDDYYTGRSLLLTGATGLLGRGLLELLLRKLDGVERVYLLIRPGTAEDGRPLTPDRRFREEILSSSAFRRLRRLHRARFDAFVAERVEVVAGDLAEERLGMDTEAWERLRRDTDVVIHCGAMTVFDAPLDAALETNALGPLRVLELARGAAKPPFVAHVSTCYVNPLEGPAFESPLDPTEARGSAEAGEAYDADEEVRRLRRRVAEIQDRDRLVEEGMEQARRRGWHDTYTYTKALGEQLFTRHRGEVPGLVLRPAIIESALRSPEPGWVEGFRMMDPLIVAYARGQLFDFPGNPESLLDIVPVDTVGHALLAAIPWTHQGDGPEVYQVASGMESPLLLKEFRDLLEDYLRRVAPDRWERQGPLPEVTFPETGRFLRRVRYRYLLPLGVLERLAAALRLVRAGRRLHDRIASRRSALQQLHRYARIYGPYAESRARFLSFHVRRLWEALEPGQREKFPFELRAIDWRRYVQEIHLPGVERHLVGLRPEEAADDAGPTEPAGSGPAGATAAAAAAVAGADNPGHGGGPEEAASDRRRSWAKVERHLALAEGADPEKVRGWIGPAYKRLTRRACRALLGRICRSYLDLQWTGRGHVPARGPFIVVCNHTSHADTAAILVALGPLAPRVHPAAATDYWFRYPGLGRILNLAVGAIPFDRRDRNVSRALAVPAEVLRQGHSVIFYPEGGRSPTGELRTFASAVGLLSLATAAPILPVHIHGAHEALPKGKVLPRKRTLRMRFGPPAAVEPYLRRLDRESVSDLARELADDARCAVASLGRAADA